MGRASQADLTEAFCSYCGHPPIGPWQLAHTLCLRCQLGMVLRASPGVQPGHGDPFLIVDRKLRVQALSRWAEALLEVAEPDQLGTPLERLLISDNGHGDMNQIARLVGLALAGKPRAVTLQLRTLDERGLRFRARVASCGAPTGALLVLTPLAGRAPRSAERRRGVCR